MNPTDEVITWTPVLVVLALATVGIVAYILHTARREMEAWADISIGAASDIWTDDATCDIDGCQQEATHILDGPAPVYLCDWHVAGAHDWIGGNIA